MAAQSVRAIVEGENMRFNSLLVSNLRAVERFEVEELSSFVMIAGQNGSGKSCVFDAVRLLKSLYGGYSANEYHQWFGEFAINLQDRHALRRMFRDPDRALEVRAQLELSASELRYIQQNAEELAFPLAWQEVTGQATDHWSFSRVSVATQIAAFQPQLDQVIQRLGAAVRAAAAVQELAVTIRPSGDLVLQDSVIAQLAFQTYAPHAIGTIEYHSASRTYTRQDLGGVTLDTRAFEDQRRQSGLYNWQAKYQDIKTELASSYIRDLIARESGNEPNGESVNDTLSELFRTFFPDKRYAGVRPLDGGSLEFPVEVPGGGSHDIDDLSSGEKEILYGYLRLRNATPRGSIILLDEPELHLNPGLLHGFADFYYRHLGVAQDNQLWLVTHSDTLLRQAVGNANYRVFHMTPASASDSNQNQANPIHLNDELDRAVIDLVGDLAAYRPTAKVVILEGESDSGDGFDVTVVRRLFPDIAKRVNLVSGGSKSRVRGLYGLLASASSQLGQSNRFYSVTDRDRDPESDISHVKQWDRYHIENYLVEPLYIRQAVQALTGNDPFGSDEGALEALRIAAREIVDEIALQLVRADLNDRAVTSLRVGARAGTTAAEDLASSMRASAARIEILTNATTVGAVEAQLDRERRRLHEACESDAWLAELPGRNILKRFVRDNTTVNYEAFTNVVLDRMVQSSFEPAGMKETLEAILLD
ncbi:MAG: AAA family ATPase [Microbacterium enclense]